MKKILVLMLALVMVFAIVSCGDDTTVPGGDNGGADEVVDFTPFKDAVNASVPATATVKVSMENDLGTLNAQYDVVYASDRSAAINYSREVFNEVGADEIKSTITGTVAMSKDGNLSDTEALGGTGALVAAKITVDESKMTATVNGNILTATISASNTASVLGTAIDADVTLILYIADGTVSSFSLNYTIGANAYSVSCDYTY